MRPPSHIAAREKRHPKRPLFWSALKAETPWLMGISCLVGGVALLLTGASFASHDKWLAAAIAAAFAVGCIWSWRVLRRMTAADIGLEE